jgi:hypothetical protein
MASDRVVIDLEVRASEVAKELQPQSDTAHAECAVTAECLARHGLENAHLALRHRWIMWDGKRWVQDSTGSVFALIRKLVLEAVGPRSAGPPLWNASRATLLAPGWNHGGGLR